MLLVTLLFLGNPKTIIFIVFVLVLFFGAKRIPELFRGVGQGVREFKDASNPQPPTSQPYNQPPPPHNQPGQYYGPPSQPYGPPQPGYGQPAPTQTPPPTPPASYNPNNSAAS